MKIRFLGTGAAFPDPERKPSAILLSTDEDHVLVDAGEGVATSLFKLGVSRQVSSVILTHAHADHVSGLLMLMMDWKHTRDEELTIFAPPSLAGSLPGWLSTARLAPSSCRFPVSIRTLSENEVLPISSTRIIPAPNTHLGNDDNGMSQSFSLNLAEGGIKGLISSDITDIDDVLPGLEELDFIVMDAAHVPLEVSISEISSRKNLKKIIFTHIRRDQEIRENQRIQFAHDGLLFDTGELI